MQVPADGRADSEIERPAHLGRHEPARGGQAGRLWLEQPYPLLLRTSLAFAVVGGFGLGLVLLLSFALQFPVPGSVGGLIQVHGQVQALGFIGLFILAVGTRLLPRFHGTRLVGDSAVVVGGLILAAGVLLRALGQPMAPSVIRGAFVAASGLLILGGFFIALFALGRTVRRGKPREPREPIVLPLTMAISLISALTLNLVASIDLAFGSVTVRAPLNEAILHLELWGFASTMVLAVARHTWPNLLLLRPGRSALVLPSLVLWAVGSLGVPLAWLLVPEAGALRASAALAQLAGVVLYAGAIRVFEPPARASLVPKVTDPPRAWVRVAFGFLALAAAINVAAALYGRLGSSESLLLLSAGRHALAQGFLLTVIVFMAGRILPGHSAYMVQHPRLLAGLIWAIVVAAALRVVGELMGGYTGVWAVAAASGGTLGTIAFVLFAVLLWKRTTPRVRDEDRGGATRALAKEDSHV